MSHASIRNETNTYTIHQILTIARQHPFYSPAKYPPSRDFVEEVRSQQRTHTALFDTTKSRLLIQGMGKNCEDAREQERNAQLNLLRTQPIVRKQDLYVSSSISFFSSYVKPNLCLILDPKLTNPPSVKIRHNHSTHQVNASL